MTSSPPVKPDSDDDDLSGALSVIGPALSPTSFCVEDIMPIADRVRQSLDALFLVALSLGLIAAVAAMILGNLAE